MAVIRMWRLDSHYCELVVSRRAFELRLIDDAYGLVRCGRPQSADAVVALAGAWERDVAAERVGKPSTDVGPLRAAARRQTLTE